MAQTTSSSSRRSKRTGSRAGRSTSRNGTSRPNASSKTRRTGSNSGGAKTSRRTTSSAGRSRSSTSKSRPSASEARGRSSSTNGPIAQAGEKVSNVASKARTPLVAAGAALAGIAGGVALKNRTNQRNPVKRLRAPSMPKALKKVDLSKVDLDSITSAANRMRAIGEQVGDVADAAEKTRKKHK